MSIIWQLIVGLIIGVLARLLLPGKEAFPAGALGWLLTAILGIVGALLGRFIGSALGFSPEAAGGWIMAIIGAIILLLIVRLLFGRGTTTAV
jgi:uncharacterized membrane protein YeaQ/YmgE (transglycosylase-associated protein family)